MGNRKQRLIAGLLAGILTGVLGPVLTAVANHSGTQSGNEPLELAAANEHDVVATAAWGAFGRSYTFEVRRESDVAANIDGTEQDASRNEAGSVVATGYACVRNSCGDHTWRGVLTSAYSDGNYLLSDPTLTYAIFEGWMRPDGLTQGCHFRVEWFGTGYPSRVLDGSVSLDEHRADGWASLDLTRDARARVTAPCWGANADSDWDNGSGGLVQGTFVSAGAREAVADVHPPRCRDLDLCS